MESLRRSGCEFVIAPGDGAFYGPEDRVHAEGRARAPVAVRHDAGRPDGRALGAEYVAEDFRAAAR